VLTGFPLLLLLAAAAPDGAADPDPVVSRTINLIVYGSDKCPKAAEDEIVVCARRPESERYRIPKSVRDEGERGSASWAARVEDLEEASRETRPGSCSPVGSFGQTGCLQQMLNQFFRARRSGTR
jgi:hypothetical protein